MWAEMSSEATNAQSKTAPDTHVQNAILDTDIAKIKHDAEELIRSSAKKQKKTDSDGENILFREMVSANDEFNEALETLTKKNAGGTVLSLGRPSDALLAGGVTNKPMRLSGDKIVGNRHKADVSELKDLPLAVSDPIAVFDHEGRAGERSILTEVSTDTGHLLVEVEVGKDGDTRINILSAEDAMNRVSRINDSLATYINKEKALEFLSHLTEEPFARSHENGQLASARDVVEAFKNPSLAGVRDAGNEETMSPTMVKTVKGMAEELHTPVRIVEDEETITSDDSRQQERMRRSKGWYNTRTGEVTVVVPNHADAEDVVATVFHEVVAHKGLRELVGEENYDEFLGEVYRHATKDVREKINRKMGKSGWDHKKATDEYLGELAEKGFEDFTPGERSLWEKLKDLVLKAIDKFLKTLHLPKSIRLGDNELRYILWRSYQKLKHGKEDVIQTAQDVVKRSELKLGEFSDAEIYRSSKGKKRMPDIGQQSKETA